MRTTFVIALIFLNVAQLLSQESAQEHRSEIKKGLPPITNLSAIKNFADTNRVRFAEIKIDSTSKLYFIIEHKLNDELFYWLILTSNESQNKIISISPQKENGNKVSFKEEVLIEKDSYIVAIEIISDSNSTYTISKILPKKFPFELSGNIVLEIIYSFYNQQQTYPYVSEPKRGSELDGMVIAFSGKVKLSENYKLEIRPAIIIQSYLVGIDLGFHLRKKINDYLFIAPGVIFHYTAPFKSGGHSGWATRDGWFAFPSITFGIPILKSLPLLISYNYARINNYYNRFQTFPTQREQKNLTSIIRIGLQFGIWDF